MSRPIVVFDACTLIPFRLTTTMLWLDEAGLFQPLWSDQILDEVSRNLPRAGRISPERAAHRVSLMRESFGAEALVDGHEALVDTMRCEVKDPHVLAAAVHAGAEAIVTFNVKDFPVRSSSPYEVEVLHPDTFMCRLLAQRPDEVVTVLRHEVEAFRNRPRRSPSFSGR
ncbi:MAG: PIN domain-containing protein [Propionibacteriaceae bacterium]